MFKFKVKKMKIVIGTRGSKLALWQANFTMKSLQKLGNEVELKIIKTQGDIIQHLTLDKLEGKGFFTKEIEDALIKGEIDLAVHSMKDVPTEQPEGLMLGGVSYRENPSDWLLVKKESIENGKVLSIKEGAIVGTSSARRKMQLINMRPDLQLKDIRGNVPTRVGFIDKGECDAVVLAAAGLSRLELDLSKYHIVKFHPREFIPAPAQGVLAWQVRKNDKRMKSVVKQLHHPEVSACTNVERSVLKLMNAGCHAPLGCYCEQDTDGNFHVWATYSDTWDGNMALVRSSSSTSAGLAEEIVALINGSATQ